MNTNAYDHTFERFYPLIGKVVVEFQTIESILNQMLMGLLATENPGVGLAAAVALSFGRKLDVLKAIAPAKITQPELTKRLNTIIASLSNVEQRRNIIIHSSYSTFGTDGVAVHKNGVSRKDGFTGGGFRVVQTSFVEEALHEIIQAKGDLGEFCRTLEREGIWRIRMFRQEDDAPQGAPK